MKLLLLDLVYPDKFENPRAEMFPFYLGACKRLGLPALWLRVALAEEDRCARNRFIVAPGAAKTKALIARIRGFGACLLLSNEKLSPQTQALLRRGAPKAELLPYTDEPPPNLSRFIGLYPGRTGKRPAASFLDFAEPLYEPEWLLAPSGQGAQIIKVHCGDDCLYRRPLAGNPFFAGVDLSEARSRAGCSFCGTPGYEPAALTTPATVLAMRQIDAAMASRALKGRRKSFMIGGIQLFHQLGVFFEALGKQDHPGADFYFSCRIDEFLVKAALIAQELPRWERRGHTFNLWNMGAENFSEAENLRMNKGISLAQIEKALAKLSRLEAAFPKTFFFHKHGGLGLIIFTPWTTLDDLRANLRAARKLGISGSLFFNSRLQLRSGLPLALLARKDGLLADSFPEHPYDSGCIADWDEEELPWRFREPGIATAYRISMRLGPMEDFPKDDPDYQSIERLRRETRDPGAWDALAMLEGAVDYLRSRPKERSVPKILGAVLEASR